MTKNNSVILTKMLTHIGPVDDVSSRFMEDETRNKS